MTGVIVAIVTVDGEQELHRSSMVDDVVTYAGGDDITPSILRRYMRFRPGVTEAEAYRVLADLGWSNAYLMAKTVEP